MTSPTALYVDGVAVLTSVRAGFWAAMIVSEASGAVASSPLALAVSLKEPASRSAWVMVWVPVHTIDAPGARLATGMAGMQVKPSSAGTSLTDTLWRVTLPLLVAVRV